MVVTRGFVSIALFAMVLIFGLAVLVLLAQIGNSGLTFAVSRAETVAVPNWLNGRQAAIEPGLVVSPHAAKHAAETLDAQRIYTMLLEGKCAAADQFCNSDGKRLYLCFDPVTGLLGGLFVQDGMIESGYGSRPTYWAAKVRGDSALFKPDKCYRH